MIMDTPTPRPTRRKTWEITDKNAAFTELHAIELVDMDGDGSRTSSPASAGSHTAWSTRRTTATIRAVVAWFKLVRKAGGQVEFVPHIINNYVGLGTQIEVADMNGDKRPDVLTAARKGAYVFLNNVAEDEFEGYGRAQLPAR